MTSLTTELRLKIFEYHKTFPSNEGYFKTKISR